jgi:hypothetical protein
VWLAGIRKPQQERPNTNRSLGSRRSTETNGSEVPSTDLAGVQTFGTRTPDPFFISRREQLVELVARHTMPAIYPSRIFADFATEVATETYMNAREPTSEKSSRAQSRLTSPSNRAPKLNW